jgi:predicted Zn-dependent protease
MDAGNDLKRRGTLALMVCLGLLILACAKVPLTGRNRLMLVDRAGERELGSQTYDKIMEESNLSEDPEVVGRVRSIGENLSGAIQAGDYPWEFNVIEADTVVNAFALPGGKVALYTGILDLADNDDQLATVIAHEMAHVVARHGGERMSQMLLAQLGGMALSEALRDESERTIDLAMLAYGVSANLLYILPYSRTHESEADYMGLIYMAKAGYDPRAAVEFWQEMAELHGGEEPPAFLSTHPPSRERVEALKDQMPEALEHYKNPGSELKLSR